jgi:hypothetical protein
LQLFLDDSGMAAKRGIDQTGDRIPNALNTRTDLHKKLVPKIDDSFPDWNDNASFKTGEKHEMAQRFARRLMEGLKPGMPHKAPGKNHPDSWYDSRQAT